MSCVINLRLHDSRVHCHTDDWPNGTCQPSACACIIIHHLYYCIIHLLRLVSTDELRVFGFLRQLQDTSIPLASYSFSFFLCPHRVIRVVDHSKNARTPCLKYANFTQNTQNLRKKFLRSYTKILSGQPLDYY